MRLADLFMLHVDIKMEEASKKAVLVISWRTIEGLCCVYLYLRREYKQQRERMKHQAEALLEGTDIKLRPNIGLWQPISRLKKCMVITYVDGNIGQQGRPRADP